MKSNSLIYIISLFVISITFALYNGTLYGEAVPSGLWQSENMSVSYHLSHKFHQIDSISSSGEARVKVDAGNIIVQGRIAVTSFNSGDTNRDSNALTVVNANAFPLATYSGTTSNCELAADSTCTLTINGNLNFHGVQQPVMIYATIRLNDEKHLLANFSFKTKPTLFGIELPELLFIPIDDEMPVSGQIRMERK